METLKITLLISSLVLVIVALVVIAGVELTGTGGQVDDSFGMESGYDTATGVESGGSFTNVIFGDHSSDETTTGNESGPWGSGTVSYRINPTVHEIVSQERYLPPLGATRCYADGTCGPAGYEPIPPGTTWCDNDGCTTVGYNTIPPHTTGDHNTYICQCDCEEVLDCLESASGTPTWKHSFALGSDDIFKP